MPQIPKRLYTLEELRLNDVRPEEFLSPEDSTLNTVRTVLQVRFTGLCSVSLSHAWLLLPKELCVEGSVLLIFFLLMQPIGNRCMQAAGLAGVTAAFFAFHLSSSQALAIVAAVMFVVVGDQVHLLAIC